MSAITIHFSFSNRDISTHVRSSSLRSIGMQKGIAFEHYSSNFMHLVLSLTIPLSVILTFLSHLFAQKKTKQKELQYANERI